MILQQVKQSILTMLRFYRYFVVLFAVGCWLNFASAENEIERMPDANLRLAVREALELAPDASLTPQQLAGLMELSAHRKKIWSLKGLEYATGLKKLFLWESPLENMRIDLTPLANLTRLESLWLFNSTIVDLTPLANLTGLKRLFLTYNGANDITPLSNLTNLEVLTFESHQGVDTKGLSRLTGLEELSLWGKGIRDITPLSNLTQLKALSLYYNEIVDLTPLANLIELKRLSFCKNGIRDITPLSRLTGLKELSLDQNEVIDLAPLANLTELEQLDVSGNRVVDLTPLSSLMSLTRLELSSNEIIDITPLSNLTQLKALFLHRNRRVDITPLVNLIGLEVLFLSKSEITDLTPLANLTQLKALFLWDNKIVDLTPLANLTRLEKLSLDDNKIVDLMPLANLKGLKKLKIRDNPIDGTLLYTLRNRNPNLLNLLPPIPLPEPGLMPDGNLAAGVRKALGLTSCSPFTQDGLRGLTSLSLKSGVTDLTGLEHATRLKDLSLPGNEIVNLTPLANLTELRTLDLSSNQVVDITPLANLTGLRQLLLENNEITDITSLANLRELGYLLLSNNEINDMVPLGNLKRLYWLELGTNQISDISVLPQLTNLQTLHIQPNPIQDVTPLRTLLKSNPTMRIDVGFIGKSLCPVMYWIDRANGTLYRCIGDTVVNLFPGLQNATSLVLSSYSDDYYYWTEKTGDTTWQIRRGIKNETSAHVVSFREELTGIPTDMTMVKQNFYVSVASGKIQRFGYGFDFEPDFITGLAAPEHLVADVLNEKFYWTEEAPDGTWHIRCAALDGANVQVVRTLKSIPLGLGIDVMGGHLYVSVASGKIQRLRVDGSDFEPNFITGLVSPGSVSVDVGGGKLYWTERDSIWGASLSGENVACVATGLGMPVHLVLDVRLPVAADAR